MPSRSEEAARWQCSPFTRIYEHAGELCLLGNDGTLRCFSDSSADVVRAMLDALQSPRTEPELVEKISDLAVAGDASSVVAELLGLLRKTGAVTAAVERAAPSAELGRLVVALSGGIAAAYAPALIELLQNRGFRIRAAATESALRFVSRMALEALTQSRLIAELWPIEPAESVPHLELAKWAELVVVYPATATTLSRIACGDCSTVVSALAISAEAPVILVPAMNGAMLSSAAVQRNLSALAQDGFWITRPSIGYEVADAPERRKPMFGAAPPVQAVVDVVSAVFEHAKAKTQ